MIISSIHQSELDTMITASCPHCKATNEYGIETGSDRLESVHETKEETIWTEKNIAFHSKKLKCRHCEKEFYVIMRDERW